MPMRSDNVPADASAHAAALSFARAASAAAPGMARASGATKNAALLGLAALLEKSAPALLAANAQDARAARAAGLSAPMLERLELTEERGRAMAAGLRQIASLADPVGEVLGGGTRPNGLRITRVRAPLGAILIIFESRPNVTVDAAGLCLKSGNACVLRGGKECAATNRLLGELIAAALAEAGLPREAVQVVDNPDRAIVNELLGMKDYLDLVVPRGGKGLIAAVAERSRIPVLKHLDGICHTYVDASADTAMAIAVTLNAKTGRPSTCNATETLLVHKAAAGGVLPPAGRALTEKGVELRCDDASGKILSAAGIASVPAAEEDWGTEYNALILSVKIVENIEEAIAHINCYGSKHTDAILTNDVSSAEKFKREVDSASVMVNASTRFADGFEYGLGAEIGISTDKLHARGPVGLDGLTTYKWLVEGAGQTRE